MDIRYVPLCKGDYLKGESGDSRTWFRRLMLTLRLDGIDAKISRCNDHIELLVPVRDYYKAFVKSHNFVNSNNFVGFNSFAMPFDRDSINTYGESSSKNIITPRDVEGNFVIRDDADRIALCSSLYFASRGRFDTKRHFKKLRDMLRANGISASVSRAKSHMELVVPNTDYYKAFTLTYDYLQKSKVYGFHAFVTPFDRNMVESSQEKTDLQIVAPEHMKASGFNIINENEEPKSLERDEM